MIAFDIRFHQARTTGLWWEEKPKEHRIVSDIPQFRLRQSACRGRVPAPKMQRPEYQ